MLNTPGSPPGKVSAPSARTRLDGSAGSSAVAAELLLDQLRGNRSIPADTGVWVVNTVPARQATSASEKLSPWLDVLADALEAEEAGVALVGVEDLRPRVPGDRAELPDRPHAADSEQQFLAEPVIAAAAVQPVGDLAQGRVVPST